MVSVSLVNYYIGYHWLLCHTLCHSATCKYLSKLFINKLFATLDTVVVTTEEERAPGLVMTPSDDIAENTSIGAGCLAAVFVIFGLFMLGDIPLILTHLRDVSVIGQMVKDHSR